MISIIPFKVLDIAGEGYHLMLKIYINRKVANVIIDTGASKTVFDKTRIEKFVSDKNFDAQEKLSSGLGTNTMQSHSTTIKKMKIGDVEISDYKAVLLDLSHVNNSYGTVGLAPVEGVLGSDILLQFNAVIDYEKKVLKLKYKKMKG
ncbi:MAG: aspartyl protease family protein [Bacteroidota bacterium]|nr:aspartyl protease family protein [Bacteroidota bacterium]